MARAKAIPASANQYEPVIDRAAREYHNPAILGTGNRTRNLGELYRAMRVCATSVHGDVAAITWHLMHHVGRRPEAVTTGRGHTYRVWLAGGGGGGYVTATVVDAGDHVRGVMGLGYDGDEQMTEREKEHDNG
jgi:hypothetical protein